MEKDMVIDKLNDLQSQLNKLRREVEQLNMRTISLIRLGPTNVGF